MALFPRAFVSVISSLQVRRDSTPLSVIRLVRIWAIAACVTLNPASVWAQAPIAEGSVAYHRLRVGEDLFRLGWLADVGFNIGDTFSIVGEVSGLHRREQAFGIALATDLFGFVGGPRIIARLGPICPYAQFLVGALVSINRVSAEELDEFYRTTAPVAQPGAGIMIRLGSNWGLVGAVDRRYRIASLLGNATSEDQKEMRIVAGVHFGFK